MHVVLITAIKITVKTNIPAAPKTMAPVRMDLVKTITARTMDLVRIALVKTNTTNVKNAHHVTNIRSTTSIVNVARAKSVVLADNY